MGIETLIERLNQYSQSLIAYKLGADFADACMDAAVALSTLQLEKEKLREELEQVKRERDAARSLLAERIGVIGAEPITTAFGLPIDRLCELARSDREGRCFIGPFVAMIEQSLSGGEMKPQRDQRFNGRYAVVYFDPKKWSSPLIDICGTPYNREEAEARIKALKQNAAEAALQGEREEKQ